MFPNLVQKRLHTIRGEEISETRIARITTDSGKAEDIRTADERGWTQMGRNDLPPADGDIISPPSPLTVFVLHRKSVRIRAIRVYLNTRSELLQAGRLEVFDHRFGPGTDMELAVDAAEVLADGIGIDTQRGTDFLV